MNTQNQVTRIENPFGNNNQVTHSAPPALITTESQRAIAEVQAALAIAKSFPRDRRAAVDRILNDCQRAGLAEVAVYQYSRGDTSINGPTIRLAESLAQNWGNIQYGVRELSQANGESTVEAFAWDVETNTRQTKIFQVPHVRYTRSGGTTKLVDPRDIYELIANNGARRLRACILGVIPGDVVEAALQQCEATLNTHADTSPEGIQKILRAFEKYGVSKESIEKRIQCRIESIKPAQVVSLTKIGTSLKEGMSAASDWFDLSLSQSSTVKTEEQSPFAALKHQILTVKNVTKIDACEDQVMDHSDVNERKQLMQLIRAQRDKLTPTQVVEEKKPSIVITEQTDVTISEDKLVLDEKKLTGAELRRSYAKALTNAESLREVNAIESQIAGDDALKPKDRDYLQGCIDEANQKLTPAEDPEEHVFDESELEVAKFKEQIEAAQTTEVLTQIKATFSANGTLSDEQHERLNAALNQKMATLKPVQQQQQQQQVDPMKSLTLQTEINKMIVNAASVQDLESIAQKINSAKSQLTSGHLMQLKQTYVERKTSLENQVDMFSDDWFEKALDKIKVAKTQDQLADLMSCPEFYELGSEEKDMITKAANKRSGELSLQS